MVQERLQEYTLTHTIKFLKENQVTYTRKESVFLPEAGKRNSDFGKTETKRSGIKQINGNQTVIKLGGGFGMDDVLEYYASDFSRKSFLVADKPPASRFFHGLRMEMDKKMGRGWLEILRIHNGIYVGLADYCLNQPLETCNTEKQAPVQLNILLSGHFQFGMPGEAKHTVAAGDIWLVHGPFDQASFTQFANENICSVAIYLPRER